MKLISDGKGFAREKNPFNPYSPKTHPGTDFSEFDWFSKTHHSRLIFNTDNTPYLVKGECDGELVWRYKYEQSTVWQTVKQVAYQRYKDYADFIEFNTERGFQTMQAYEVTSTVPVIKEGDKKWDDLEKKIKTTFPNGIPVFQGDKVETVEEAAREYATFDGDFVKHIYDAVIFGIKLRQSNPDNVCHLDTGEPRNLGVANGIDPCPFCGAKEGEGVILGQRNHLFMITCTKCGVQTRDDRKDKVQHHWNRRDPDKISRAADSINYLKIEYDHQIEKMRSLGIMVDQQFFEQSVNALLRMILDYKKQVVELIESFMQPQTGTVSNFLTIRNNTLKNILTRLKDI